MSFLVWLAMFAAWLGSVVLRITLTAAFVYYYFYDREALFAWGAEWWEVILSVAGIYYIIPKMTAKFNFKQ